MARAPLTKRRIVGLDRSVKPPATARGQPLRPFTLPNGIGLTRLLLIPVFVLLAFSSQDGRTASATILYAVIGASDYLDGLVARLTGQFSRLGALLDPFVDRLYVLSGVVVTWHFELLPRWALAILAAREVLVVGLTWLALRLGRDLEINAWGRWAVWPTMFSIFLALVADTWVATALLLIGVGMTLVATTLYLRTLTGAGGAGRSPSTSA
ncbi:MAG TPA: CDP-alcohol phosphatidyltransferase family protein [Thermoleophilaceae bacterium]|nr:CDP-alcohol phosphatidyltransferase family protein [Thermoleophilaceae bacterium]